MRVDIDLKSGDFLTVRRRELVAGAVAMGAMAAFPRRVGAADSGVFADKIVFGPVSYTHLTLPTILRV